MGTKLGTSGSAHGDRAELTSKDSSNRTLVLSDMPWSKSVYVDLRDKEPGTWINFIIKRKHLKRFLKATKPAKRSKYTYPDALQALEIGTRFTHYGDEYIKIGEDAYIETKEAQVINAMNMGLSPFFSASDFEDEENDANFTVVDD